ncbi:hypothetical protein BBK82_38270 [Lentzea guizhouensis]|uniref:Uncharacterized protein n=2 Tax=Lentzea guizhouensis TaxID=1586287 RepID=A0A1B2HTF3_9PSEU|nr:hypothetical protein BBK82_38270 [Lentzea guizhouensis]
MSYVDLANLARYVHHTRRGSEQLMADADAELVSLVSGYLPVPVGIEVLAVGGTVIVTGRRPELSRLVEVITERFGEPVVIADQDVLGNAVVVSSTAG